MTHSGELQERGSAAAAVVPGDVVLAVDRIKGLVQGLLWCLPTAMVGLSAGLIWSHVDIGPSGASNGIVAMCLAILAVVLAIIAVVPAFLAVRWLLLAVWPGRLGVFAGNRELAFRLGPFGAYRYDAFHLEVLYPYEIAEEVEGGVYEALLPPDEQRSRFVPRISHPKQREPLHRMVLRFTGAEEAELAKALAPAVAHWRSRRAVEATP